ncbi:MULTISPECIES: D-glycerate dehydrogenase [unclassified Ruegeria]|uniref:2-hydroxyacid dehydrogenase n=1 Tax=unclassified Ruegeria TaxID=2625375 RepID=UPI0014892825|nr:MULTISPECIES: D-glycerate dehydrogenase [unclassified Ruegeria]NOD36473.1 D-glycerate dehydrogenase [Ruegeria sp. HKCCD7296]NOD49719.1 D-glycerate dehydrogenase [Ruegeria sp. HKCCD5849]NOD53927.1 D-glycerate dehydrogenase [Ruegeria sp. HKCCD5851]NOD68872.1 D-glycerate dehydrogenase [Ruegeria sp. HKCCD7303]NOE34576.1 D-glycerate dehydrogenase [Ruegeria sp. HKCCD7318]
MVKPSVLVTRRWPAAVEAQLAENYNTVLNTGDKPLSPSEIRQALKSYDAVLPTVTDTLSAEALDVSGAQTKILANYGVGYSHICEPSARELGMTVTNTPDILSECTADIAMTLLLMVARRAGEGERELRSGNWTGWRPTHLVGTKVSGKTLGIIGYGRIGQEMARRAHHGFGMDVLVYNRSPVDPAVLARCKATQVGSIDELLPQCDFVSLHCPGGAANRHLINARRLDLMKPDAFLINTARGEVIDERALVQSLAFDMIGGAALDVFDGEPRICADLLQCDNLVMLPHLGSATREAREAMGFRVLDNLRDFFEGREPRDRVI